MPGSDEARLKTHRFFGPFDLGRPVFVIEDREISHQIASVLRLRPGETVILLDGSGLEAEARITRVDQAGVEVSIVEKRRCAAEPARRVTLYAAVLKRENFEFIVQKATETGASRIVPLISGRTVKQGTKRDRLMKIAREAAEQSGRGRIPEIFEPMRFKDALEDSRSNDMNVIFEPGSPVVISADLPSDAKIGIFIGPEGGWTEDELGLARKSGISSAGLGPLILRAETAAVVAVFLASQAV